jgi:hypothetical protein
MTLITTTSPDGQIQARISGPDGIEVAFRRGAFGRYDEPSLSHQLERLCALSWIAHERARTEQLRRTLGRGVQEFAAEQRYPKDERRQQYDADLAEVRAEGTAPSGLIRVQARGMLRWRVDIQPGALRRLGERAFLNELAAAVRALLADRDVKITLIKSRYYDLGVPRPWRDLLNELAAVPT